MDVMSLTFFEETIIALFEGAVTSLFAFDSRRVVKYVGAVSNCWLLDCVPSLYHRSQRYSQLSQLNGTCSQDLSDQVLMVEPWNLDANPDPSLPPGPGWGAEAKQVHHEHQFGRQRYWGRGRRGLVCGGLHWMLRHVMDVMSLTCFEENHIALFEGAVTSLLLLILGELSNM